MPLAVANIETLDASPFVVINLYGNEGNYLIDQIIVPYENPQQAVKRILSLRPGIGQPLDCWTASKEIFAESLGVAGVNGIIKHRDDVTDTAAGLKDAEEILRDIYEIEPIVPKPKLPEWRGRLFCMLLKIANQIGGNGKYEI